MDPAEAHGWQKGYEDGAEGGDGDATIEQAAVPGGYEILPGEPSGDTEGRHERLLRGAVPGCCAGSPWPAGRRASSFSPS